MIEENRFLHWDEASHEGEVDQVKRSVKHVKFVQMDNKLIVESGDTFFLIYI